MHRWCQNENWLLGSCTPGAWARVAQARGRGMAKGDTGEGQGHD